MLAGEISLPHCRSDREILSERLIHRRDVTFRDWRRDEGDLEIIDVKRRSPTVRLDVQSERGIGEYQVVVKRQTNPRTRSYSCIWDDCMERRWKRSKVSLQTHSQLTTRFTWRELGPQRDAITRAIKHDVRDVEGWSTKR